MHRSIVAVLALLFITACEPTIDTYVKDAKKREEKLRECADMGIIAAKDDTYCQMAMDAQAIVVREAASQLLDSITLQSSDKKSTPAD